MQGKAFKNVQNFCKTNIRILYASVVWVGCINSDLDKLEKG